MNLKEKAIQFLQMIIKGEIDDAYEKFVNMDGKHHNVHYKAGFIALKEAMKHNHTLFPTKKFNVVLTVAENDIVAVYTKVGIADKKYGVSYFFEFKDGKIIEMWDNAQEIPCNIINKDGAF